MLKTAMTECMREEAAKRQKEIGAVLSGDLLNQLMSSSFMAGITREMPFLGMYGPCSTMTESVDAGVLCLRMVVTAIMS